MTINEQQDNVIREMSQLGDWFDKYEYLIALGRDLPPLPREYRTDEYAISGCQSAVWIVATPDGDWLRLAADSDALITKGILALLLRVLNDQPAHKIADADLYFIEKTGLGPNLSPSRANGLAAIVKHIKNCAATA